MKNIKKAALRWTLAVGLTVAPLLCAQTHPVNKPPIPAIEVEMVQDGEMILPADFQVALYENLVQELQKRGNFSQVYRDGDRNAAGAPDLIILHTTVTGFKKGSEMERNVTTVAGATSIKVHCKFTDKERRALLERDINGVRFFGDNLKATNDFAKKANKVGSEQLPSTREKSDSEILRDKESADYEEEYSVAR